jgi:GT2 family glycosyltransferase
MECLLKQTKLPEQIIIVDSGSTDLEYLEGYAYHPLVIFYAARNNIGFCRGNNLGLSLVADQVPYILFLNPDAFLSSTFIEQALDYMNASSQKQTGAISGLLLGFDIQRDRFTNKIDSCGIFRKWYGRWYDRHQGEVYQANNSYKEERVPALCGALIFARRKALNEILLKPNELWDNSFYMYKEDIDLSLRLNKKGWHIKFVPQLIAYHCRGWQKKRKLVPRHLRLLSAKNEVKVFMRSHSPCMIYSSIKYLCVKLFDV